jgi:hypothetical protein
MVILIGIVLALGALYWWLLGHWYARIIMLFPFAALFGFIGIAAGISSVPDHNSMLGVVGGTVGIAIAWFVSGAPIYYYRHRAQAGT